MNWKRFLWLSAVAAGFWANISTRAADLKALSGHVPAAVRGQQSTGRLPPGKRLNLAIGLPLRNTEALTNLLHELYDPNSPNFRNYLTPEQFAQQFGPTEQDYEAVIAFAEANGFTVTGTHPNRMLLDVSGAVGDIERAFHVRLGVYAHPKEAREFYAPEAEPSVDASLPVLDISGLSDYGRPHPMSHKKTPLAPQPNGTGSSGGAFIGNDFRAAYVPGTSLTGSNQVVGLLQFDGFYASDITAYEQEAGLPNVPLQTVLLDGFSGSPTTGPNSGNAEVSLDIEMVISMAPGLSKVMVYEGNPLNFIPNDPMNRMATDNLAKQLSSSWAWSGGPNSATDQILQQYIAQGQSYFQASGDSDAYTGAQVLDQPSQTTTPMDSPYVICVGGTTLTTTGPGGAWVSETVWNWGNNTGSGGGVSATYSIPTWQTNVNMSANLGSTTKRNIPDVALTADNVHVLYGGNGSSATFGGTSCAAPLWAGFTALINQQAAIGGKPPVGFLNPAIYALGKGSNYTATFHDTTVGNNIGTNTPGKYFAVAGYDLCTGWGTPVGTNLINALAPLLYVPVIASKDYSLIAESSTPTNSAVDPGETVTLSISLQNTGAAPSTNLVAALQAGNGVLGPGPAQTYGALAPLGGTASRPFTFTAAGSCGSIITLALQLHDGASSLGTVSLPVSLGRAVGAQSLAQNFDGVTAPALPAGWATSVVTGPAANWVTTTASKDTSPNSAFCADSVNPSANALVSPVTAIVLPSAQITFRHNFKLERSGSTYYDGAVLEIRIGTGAFTDILAAGGSFAAGGYNGAIASSSDNPLPGRQAWVNTSSGWKTVTVNLPAAAAGQNIQLRWVLATDTGNSGTVTGWYVDSISLSDASLVCNTVIADVAASLSISPDSLSVGQNLNYTISVTNAGPQPATAVIVTNTIPAGVAFVSASPGCTYSAGSVVCPLGMMPAAAVSNITVILAPVASGPFTNTVSVASVTPDSNLTNNRVAMAVLQTGGVPPAITVQPTNQLAFPGDVASFQASAAGTGPLSYQWFFDRTNLLAGATASTLTLGSVQPAQAGGYTVVVTNAYGSVTSSVAVLVVAQPPAITMHPAGQTLRVGSNALFSVTAGGTSPLSYQWFFNATNSVPGATTSTLTLGNVQPAQAGGYTVVVTNAYGSVTSSVAVLVVAQPPAITAQPAGQTLRVGSNALFSVIASGTAPLIYQWFFNTTNPVPGATTSTLTLGSVQPAQAGGYTVVVTNAYGSVTSSVATLVVVQPPVIMAHPAGQTLRVGSNAVFTVTAGGTGPLSFQWFFNRTNSLAGATASILALINVQPTHAGTYSVVVTNAYGSVTSSMASLVVAQPPAILLHPAGQTLRVGSNAVFSVMAVGSEPLSYQWFFNATNSLTTETPKTLVLMNVQPEQAGAYSVVVTNAYGSVTSTVAPLVVALPPAITLQPVDQLPLVGNDSFLSVVAGGTGPLSYQWFFNATNPLAGATASALALTNVRPEQAGGYTVVVTNDYGSVTSSVASLVVALPPVISVQTGNQTLPVGGDTLLSVVAGGTGPLSYQWFFNATNPLAGETSSTLALTNVQPEQAGGYTVVVTNAYGSVTSSVASLVVALPPVISVQTGNQTLPVGSTAFFSVTAVGTALLSYQWFFNATNLLGGETAGTFVLINVQAEQAGGYTVVVTNAYGSVTSSVAVLVALQPPSISVQPGDQTLPVGSNALFSVTVVGSEPLSYQWFFNGTNLLAGATASTLTLTNVQLEQAGRYTALVTNLAGTAASDSAALRALIPPVSGGLSLSFPAGQVSISLQSAAGLIYTLEYAPSLWPPQWTSILPSVTGTGGFIVLSDTNSLPLPDVRFYRIRCE